MELVTMMKNSFTLTQLNQYLSDLASGTMRLTSEQLALVEQTLYTIRFFRCSVSKKLLTNQLLEKR